MWTTLQYGTPLTAVKETFRCPPVRVHQPTLIAASILPAAGMSALADPRQLNFGGFGEMKTVFPLWLWCSRYCVSHLWYSDCTGNFICYCCHRYLFIPPQWNILYWFHPRCPALLWPAFDEGAKIWLLPVLSQVCACGFMIMLRVMASVKLTIINASCQTLHSASSPFPHQLGQAVRAQN